MKKYKPVAQKIRPVYQDLPDKFRIIHDIKGDPLNTLPKLNRNPFDFVPMGHYTAERKEQFDKVQCSDFLWPEEWKLLHHFMMENNEAFTWDSLKGEGSSQNISLQWIFLLYHIHLGY